MDSLGTQFDSDALQTIANYTKNMSFLIIHLFKTKPYDFLRLEKQTHQTAVF